MCVINPGAKTINTILTRSTALDFVRANKPMFAEGFIGLTVNELDLHPGAIVKIDENARPLTAFRKVC